MTRNNPWSGAERRRSVEAGLSKNEIIIKIAGSNPAAATNFYENNDNRFVGMLNVFKS